MMMQLKQVFFTNGLWVVCLLFWMSPAACTPKDTGKAEVKPNESPKSFSSEKEAPAMKSKAAEQALTEGKIVDMRGLDGCKFLIELADGSRLQPINLAKEFQVDGLAIQFKASPAEGMMSICMAGPMVRIEEIKKK